MGILGGVGELPSWLWFWVWGSHTASQHTLEARVPVHTTRTGWGVGSQARSKAHLLRNVMFEWVRRS